MFGLPKGTEIKKPIHKNLIYQKFATELSGSKKASFDGDISRIILVNEISPVSTTLKVTDEIKSIFVVMVELKRKEYKEGNLSLISRLFGQNILLILHYEEEYRLAIYQTKILQSEWGKEDSLQLNLDGLDLGAVWAGFVTQVSGIKADAGNTLDEQITIEAEKEKIRKQIEVLGVKARKETQAKKKFELHQEINSLKKHLEAFS